MKKNPDEIRDAVKEYYSARALTSSPCCGDQLYQPELTLGLPEEVVDFSLGCGDPISEARLGPGEIVLDLGSGGGLDCFLAAKKVGVTGRVIGVDMTNEMIDRARKAAGRLGITNVEFRQGYLEELPVGDASVDVILSNCVINLSPEKSLVFGEMFRALKPGGRVSISDIVTSGSMPEAFKENLQAWSACLSGAIPAEEYAEGLRLAGFVDVSVHPKGIQDTALSLVPVGEPFSAIILARKP